MKRNESILVYGVAGLLLVILVVAVVFGNDQKSLADQRSRTDQESRADQKSLAANGQTANDTGATEADAVDLEDLMNVDPAAELAGAGADGEPAAGTSEGDAGSKAPGDGDAGSKAAASDGAVAGGEGAPQASPVGVAEASIAGTVRMGDYRQVTVRPGDTFSMLVQRWCGSLDQLPLCEALNEDIDPNRLPVGRTVLLPWVPDDELAQLQHERAASSVRLDVATGQTYKLKSGDSLWKIAVQATGSRGSAPGYIDQIMQLNPGLVPEKLHVGQEIVLPK